MRIVFAGTPEVAVPSLRRLLASSHEVVAVVTRPDAPSGRGRQLKPSPVAAIASEHEIPVLKPQSARTEEFATTLRAFEPEACAIVAYGALLPTNVLEIPRHGWVNVHFSLLPQWRGAAPVQQAIWHGDDLTGATTFLLDQGMDTGPVFGTVTAPIRPTDTSGQLLESLADSGAELLAQTLDGISSGQLTAVVQSNDGVSLAPKLSVADARVDWNLPAHVVDRRIRACTPAPGAWTQLGDIRVKLGPVSPVPPDGNALTLTPGVLMLDKQAAYVGTGTSAVRLGAVKPAGKKEMVAMDWFRGLQLNEEAAFE